MSTGEGIVGLHAYSILDVKEIDNVKIGRQQSIKEFFSSAKAKTTPTKEVGHTPNPAQRQCIKMPTYL